MQVRQGVGWTNTARSRLTCGITDASSSSGNPVAGLDGYELRNLATHLARSGREADLHLLLALPWGVLNAWYEAKDAAGDLPGYLADVAIARRLAYDACAAPAPESTRASTLALTVRYALVAASIRSIAGTVLPSVLAALVRTGVWSPDKAVAYARQDPSPYDRVQALAALVPSVTAAGREQVAREALTVAGEVGAEQRADVLARLAPDLPDEVLENAVSVARSINGPPTDEATDKTTRAWEAMLSRLPLPAALGVAREDAPEWLRADAVAWVGSRADEPQRTALLREALDGVVAERDELTLGFRLQRIAPFLTQPLHESMLAAVGRVPRWSRGDVYIALAPTLGPEDSERAVGAVAELEDPAVALAALAGRLPAWRREEVLAEALAAVREVSTEFARAPRLAAVGAHLTGRLLAEALIDALALDEPGPRVTALAGLIDRLPQPQRGRAMAAALEAAIASDDEQGQAWYLALIAPHLSREHRRRALTAARALGEESRARVLAALLPGLPEPDAFVAAMELAEDEPRATALAALSPDLPVDLIARAAEAALELTRPHAQRQALDALVPKLPGDLLLNVLTRQRAVMDGEQQCQALAGFAARCPEPRRSELTTTSIETARQLRAPAKRVNALAGIAAHVTDRSAALLDVALAEATTLEGIERARALNVLGPALPESLAERACAAARSLDVQMWQVQAISAIARSLPASQQRGVLEEALELASGIDEPSARGSALQALGPLLPEDLAERAFRAAEAIDWIAGRAWALQAIGPRLPERLVPEAIAVARRIDDEQSREAALSGLIPRLPLSEALREAAALHDAPSRGRALLALAPSLRKGDLPVALDVARSLDPPYWRAQVLLALQPHAQGSLSTELLGEAIAALGETLPGGDPRAMVDRAAPGLLSLSRPELLVAWEQLLANFEQRARADLLLVLEAAAAVVERLGGPGSADDCARTVLEVTAAWP